VLLLLLLLLLLRLLRLLLLLLRLLCLLLLLLLLRSPPTCPHPVPTQQQLPSAWPWPHFGRHTLSTLSAAGSSSIHSSASGSDAVKRRLVHMQHDAIVHGQTN
jgi:hypothetical protein